PREQLLAGSARPQKHHRNASVRYTLNRSCHTHHLWRSRDQAAKNPAALARPLGKRTVLRFDPMKIKRTTHDQTELFDVHRLLVEIVSAPLDRGERTFTRAMTRGDDNLGVRLQGHD